MSRLWVDVSDLFGHHGAFSRPSGIQRVIFELGQALAATDPDEARIRFVRASGSAYLPVAWRTIAQLFLSLTDEAPPHQPPLTTALQLQFEALRALLAIPQTLRPPTGEHGTPAAMERGDTLLILGAGWSDVGQVARLAALRQRHAIRIALLVHDIIPLLRPEWSDPIYAARFRQWFDGMLPLCDRLLANSAFTAADVARYRRTQGLPDCDIPLIRLGDGFSQAGPGAEISHGINRPYALVVSTIELRKNHALLVDAWQALLARHGPDAVPALVFAGREGALSHDLMQRLHATKNLGGHVILRPSASDAEIAALYRGCSFTVFPSLYEGWGLPVAESLAFGKPCLASNATSVPEVGGDLASYFDPLDLSATIACLEAILGDPAGLADWEAEIRRDFRPTPWSHTAEGLLAGVA